MNVLVQIQISFKDSIVVKKRLGGIGVFDSKRRTVIDDSLQAELELLETTYAEKNTHDIERLACLKSLINAAVHQHEIVNAQQNVLAGADNQIENKFEEIRVPEEQKQLTEEVKAQLQDTKSLFAEA